MVYDKPKSVQMLVSKHYPSLAIAVQRQSPEV
jgi:hypothetical protein